jgi:hypothetical protein
MQNLIKEIRTQTPLLNYRNVSAYLCRNRKLWRAWDQYCSYTTQSCDTWAEFIRSCVTERQHHSDSSTSLLPPLQCIVYHTVPEKPLSQSLNTCILTVSLMEAFTVEHSTSESQYERISTPNTQSTSPRIHPWVIIVCDRSIGTNIRSSPSNYGNHPHRAIPTRVKSKPKPSSHNPLALERLWLR